MNLEIIKTQIKENNSCTSSMPNKKINILVRALRLVSSDVDIKDRELNIPDGCEDKGFVEGYHNLGQLLHFLADMLEE
jgi:hypothetical protein